MVRRSTRAVLGREVDGLESHNRLRDWISRRIPPSRSSRSSCSSRSSVLCVVPFFARPLHHLVDGELGLVHRSGMTQEANSSKPTRLVKQTRPPPGRWWRALEADASGGIERSETDRDQRIESSVTLLEQKPERSKSLRASHEHRRVVGDQERSFNDLLTIVHDELSLVGDWISIVGDQEPMSAMPLSLRSGRR